MQFYFSFFADICEDTQFRIKMVDNVSLSDLGKDELLEIIRKQASQIQALQVYILYQIQVLQVYSLYQIQALHSTVYTRYRSYRSYFIPDTGLTGHTLYQIQALQVVLISLEWPVSSYSHYINCVFFNSLFRWCYLVEESLDV